MAISKLAKTLTSYNYFPKELFRVQIGIPVRLRPEKIREIPEGRFADFAHHQRERLRRAKVELEIPSDRLRAPKGCPVLPNSKFLQAWIRGTWQHKPDAKVWVVQQGTPLPDNLILIHQGDTQVWSIDPVGKQTLTELNDNINNFLTNNAALITPQQWMGAYPRAEKVEKILSPKFKLDRRFRARRSPHVEPYAKLESKRSRSVMGGPRLGVSSMYLSSIYVR